MFKPSSDFLADRSKAVLLLWIFFLFVFRVILFFSLQPCGHQLGKGWPLGSLECYVFLCFVTFPYGVLGQLCYLIVWIPDLCRLPYFFYFFLFYHVHINDIKCLCECSVSAVEC